MPQRLWYKHMPGTMLPWSLGASLLHLGGRYVAVHPQETWRGSPTSHRKLTEPEAYGAKKA